MLKCPNCNTTESIEIYDVMDIEFNGDNSKIRTLSCGCCECCGALVTWKSDYSLTNVCITLE